MTDPMNSYGNCSSEKPSFSSIALIVFIFLECLVAAQAFFAYGDSFLTVSQMRQRGVNHGLPFVWHFAMWSDLAIISPLVGYLVGHYYRQWASRWILVSLTVGLISSGLLHWLYTFSAIPEAHIQAHKLTTAGILHLLYMAISIAIFVNFFVFTENISNFNLRIVSVILILHVFVGTHMVLGILSMYFPLPWYPGQPLKNIFGWATIAILALGLFWRNFRNVEIYETWEALKQKPITRFSVDLWEFWTLQRFDTTEKYFRLLDYIADKVGFFSFLGVFVAKLQLSTAFKGGVFRLENWVSFISDTALPCLLMLLLGAIYALSRHSAKLELAIAPKLFPSDGVPTDWGSKKQHIFVFIAVIGFLLFYLLLTWYADNIKIASFLMFVVSCNDWRTRYLIQEGINRYFGYPAYEPKPEEKNYAVIQKRRAVAREFLFEKPHLRKETGRVAGCGLAFVTAMIGYSYGINQFDFLAYVILILTIILNEIYTLKWRFKMYKEMKSLI